MVILIRTDCVQNAGVYVGSKNYQYAFRFNSILVFKYKGRASKESYPCDTYVVIMVIMMMTILLTVLIQPQSTSLRKPRERTQRLQ